MDFHRSNKLKGSETTKYQRLPSPMTYIQNYNKVCSEENEQTKQCMPIDKKHNNLFLWNDGYIQLNRIKIPTIMEERKQKRKAFQQNTISQPSIANNQNQTYTIPTHMSQYAKDISNKIQNADIEEDNQDLYKNYKQLREKQEEQKMQLRTERLEQMMKENNANQTRIKKNREEVLLIDNNQRKFFSHTKQQMIELQNHIMGSQKISKEIMDRRGLSLRKVLSSIPQDKLMQIIDYKQYHFQKIMNEKILPKQQFRLKNVISPKFTGEYNYDFNKTARTKFFNQTNSQLMPNSTNSKIPLNKPMSQEQLFRTKSINSRRQIEYNDKNLKDGNQLKKLSSIKIDKKEHQHLNNQKSKNSIRSIQSQGKIDIHQHNNYVDNNFEDDEDEDRDAQIKDIQLAKKKELRIKSTNEVQQTIQKLNEIQEESIRQQKIQNQGLRIPPEMMGQLASITYKPKFSLDKMLQKDDEMERQIFIQSLQNTQKENEKKNFFNYSNYFYGKYSKQNNGLSTKLSQGAIKENDNFQQGLIHLISQVDQDHNVKISF
ncbi:hypothetical protein ABPG72_003739 [Tetrahymena utriculariae]